MSLSSKRTRQRATFVGALIGFIIIFTFVLSLVAPNLGSSTSSDVVPTSVLNTPEPTRIIVPTPEDDPQLGGALPYVHSSGLFQTFRPAGDDWALSDNPFGASGERFDVVLQSSERLVVVHTYVQSGISYDSLDALSQDYLTEAYYAGEWGNYASWQETGREVTDDAVIVNFDLSADGVDYLGRDVTRLDGDRLYVARFIVPANNPVLLDVLTSEIRAAFFGYVQMAALPGVWPAYVDQQLGFVLKHPPGWETVAGAPGRLATLRTASGQRNATVRLDAQADQPLASAADAEAWVLDAEPSAEVLESTALEHPTGSGYAVAYSFRAPSGDPRSGLVVLLNDDTGALFSANLQLETPDVNLLVADGLTEDQSELAQALLDGFMILPLDARLALPAATSSTGTATEAAADLPTEAPPDGTAEAQ